ncbi:MAG: hypothetical protein IJZ80_07090 [Clostridia bacterium]|nr:hypothetical protein [Clostridia bacterium]
MNIEKTEMHATVREGYQILLRAEAALLMPTDQPKLRAFYEKLANTCMKWATEVHGEGLRKDFLALESVRERSSFRTQRYRLGMRIAYEDACYAAIICESNLTDQWREPQKSYHRISHVWDIREETVLPLSQILSRFGMHLGKSLLPFKPDGVYPEGNFVVCFRNVTENTPFLEKKLPRSALNPEKREKNQKMEKNN